jgi:hypothetical protein
MHFAIGAYQLAAECNLKHNTFSGMRKSGSAWGSFPSDSGKEKVGTPKFTLRGTWLNGSIPKRSS